MSQQSASVEAKTPCGPVGLTINSGAGDAPCVVIRARNGSCLAAVGGAISGLINQGLGQGIPLSTLLSSVRGHTCDRAIFQAETKRTESCLTTIGRRLSALAGDVTPDETPHSGAQPKTP